MRRLMWFTIGLCMACLLAVYWLPAPWLGWAALGGGLSFCGLLLLRRRPAPVGRRVRCAALGLSFGLVWCWGCDCLRLSPARASEGRFARLEAELCSYPTPTPYGCTVEALALVSGREIKTRFYVYGTLPPLEPGDRIAGPFTLRRADRDADGETRLDLQARGVLLIASGRVEATAVGSGSLSALLTRFSHRVSLRLGELIPADAAGLPRAMLTGDRSGLSDEARSDLTMAGASHILAVSGLHVSMLMAILWLLAGRGLLSTLLGLPLLVIYALMTGASPSVLRAAIMLLPLLLAPPLREESDTPTSLSLAAAVLLLDNPWAIANLSFQLSFAAVAGLLLVTPPLLRTLEALPPVRRLLGWNGLKGLPLRLRRHLLRLLRLPVHWFCGSVSASLGALLFTTPIAAAAYGRVPVYGILTNLLVLIPAGLCLGGALVVLGLGLLSTELGLLAGRLLALPVRLILLVCRRLARLPGSQLYLDGYGLGFLIFGALLVLLSYLCREKRLGLPLLSLLTALVLAVGLQRLEAASAAFTLAALDVGQGQCVCAVSDAFTAVIDCGGTAGTLAGTDAAAWLRERGVTRIDALVLTHYDRDHVSGVETLLTLLPVEAVYLPEVDADPENRAAVERAALTAGAALHYVTENRTLSFPGGRLRLFAPVSDRSDNAACVSVLYSVGEYDMLVTGDLDAAAESALLARNDLPRVELYVAGHHGSSGSSSEALLETIRPDTVFVSVGPSSYGLPSPKALARFAACGAQVFRTDKNGTLEIGR